MSKRSKLLWQIIRHTPVPYDSEILVEDEEGIWYRAFEAKELTPDGKSMMLSTGPWATAKEACDANSGIFDVRSGDEVPTNRLPLSIVFYRIGFSPGCRDYQKIGDDTWIQAGGWWIPDNLPVISSWSTGDSYGMPSGDRRIELWGRDGFYAIYDDGPLIPLGESVRDADDAWDAYEFYVPPSFTEDLIGGERWIERKAKLLVSESESVTEPFVSSAECFILEYLEQEALQGYECLVDGFEMYNEKDLETWWEANRPYLHEQLDEWMAQELADQPDP